MRHHRATPTVAAAGALLLLGGCGTVAARTTAPSAPRRASSVHAVTARACTSAVHTVCLTAASSGQRITLSEGTVVHVDLRSAESSWRGLSEVGPLLLRRLDPPRRTSGAVEASYAAVEPGHTELRAFERPICQPTRACPQFIVLWQVDIRVRRD
jgi:hypothetical protein